MVDERIKSARDNLDRADRAAEAREARGGERGLEPGDEIRMQMFRDTLFRTSLPNLPPIPGYHVCWLTTTNPRDNLAQRRQVGYEPVTPEDIPGFEHIRSKDGEMAGFISVNEMVAFKIPERLYQAYMMAVHHDSPLEEEQKLQDTMDQLQAGAAYHKGKIVVEQGSAQIRQYARPPNFNAT